MTSSQVRFQDRSAECVFRIDHVAEANTSRLRQEEISLVLVPFVIADKPVDQLTIGNSRVVLHWPCRSDSHDESLVFEPWPCDGPVLDEVDLDGRRRRDLDSHTAQLAVALRGMTVAEIEIGVLVMYRKVDDGTGCDIWEVHISAPVVWLQRRHCL